MRHLTRRKASRDLAGILLRRDCWSPTMAVIVPDVDKARAGGAPRRTCAFLRPCGAEDWPPTGDAATCTRTDGDTRSKMLDGGAFRHPTGARGWSTVRAEGAAYWLYETRDMHGSFARIVTAPAVRSMALTRKIA